VYHRQVQACSAFILAGGKSTRMGSDKAFLVLEGRTLLERALGLCAAVTTEVRIVGDAHRLGGYGRVVEDLHPECGPLGGIHAALLSSETRLNLILGVDMPFLESGWLRFLVSQARRTSALATVPRVRERLQPLCAVYEKEFAQAAQSSLEAGENKIGRLFLTVETKIVEEAEIASAGYGAQMFENLNTPEDWDRARSRIETGR
jgi:molybdopterin-guanine dinucleotide biosynthesis protein A